jgi:hypothetical protein
MLGFSTTNESGMAQRKKREYESSSKFISWVLVFNFVGMQFYNLMERVRVAMPCFTNKSERCTKQRVSSEDAYGTFGDIVGCAAGTR